MVKKELRTFKRKELKTFPLVLACFENLGMDEFYLRTLTQRNEELREKVVSLEKKVNELIDLCEKNNKYFYSKIEELTNSKNRNNQDLSVEYSYEPLVKFNEDANK